MLVVLAGVAGCDDRGAPTGPPPPPPAAARVISCQADVRAGTFDCTTPTAPSGRLSADLVLGGQGTYVALRSSNVSYTSGTATFQADVTVENLTVLPLGTADGSSVTGVKVFFSSGPTVTSGTGTVTVANPDGTGTFTGTSQPYFLYNQILATAEVSAPRTWTWTVPTTVNRFAFQVLVDAASPQPHTVLRWLYDPLVDGTDLSAVWSASAGDGFAVGLGGKILHYNGTSWTAQPSPTTADLAGVGGSSGTDVFAVGTGGTIHYDGTSWTGFQSVTLFKTPLYLSGAGGSSGSAVLVVGALRRVTASRSGRAARCCTTTARVGRRSRPRPRTRSSACGAVRGATCSPSAKSGLSCTTTAPRGRSKRAGPRIRSTASGSGRQATCSRSAMAAQCSTSTARAGPRSRAGRPAFSVECGAAREAMSSPSAMAGRSDTTTDRAGPRRPAGRRWISPGSGAPRGATCSRSGPGRSCTTMARAGLRTRP